VVKIVITSNLAFFWPLHCKQHALDYIRRMYVRRYFAKCIKLSVFSRLFTNPVDPLRLRAGWPDVFVKIRPKCSPTDFFWQNECKTLTVEVSIPKMWATSEIVQKTAQNKHHPLCENSPKPVSLSESKKRTTFLSFFSQKASKNFFFWKLDHRVWAPT
jgi:hypothetical protein